MRSSRKRMLIGNSIEESILDEVRSEYTRQLQTWTELLGDPPISPNKRVDLDNCIDRDADDNRFGFGQFRCADISIVVRCFDCVPNARCPAIRDKAGDSQGNQSRYLRWI